MPAATSGRGLVQDIGGSTDEGDFDVRAANAESERDHRDCAGCAQGSGGEGVPGRRAKPDGAGIRVAATCERNAVPRQEFRVIVEPKSRWRRLRWAPKINACTGANVLIQDTADSALEMVDSGIAVCL